MARHAASCTLLGFVASCLLLSPTQSFVAAPARSVKERRGQGAHRETPEEAAARRGERRGFYVRPSAAIEKGGGFFVPGLEGQGRLQSFVGLAVLALLATNRVGIYEAQAPQSISEGVAATAALLLLVQSPFEGGQAEVVGGAPHEAVAAAFSTLRVTYLAERVSTKKGNAVLWSGSAFLDRTSAQAAVLVHAQSGEVVAAVGSYEASHPFANGGMPGVSPITTQGTISKCMAGFEAVAPYLPSGSGLACILRAASCDGLTWVVSFADEVSFSAEARRWMESLSKFPIA